MTNQTFNPASDAEMVGKVQEHLRKQLQTMRDTAMEIAATMESGMRSDPMKTDIWKFAGDVIERIDFIMLNTRGEFDLD